jgi:CRP-like cAMP-binding protein
MVLHVTVSAPARGATRRGAGEGRAGSAWSGWAALLSEVPLFQSLSKRHLRKVARLAHLRWYANDLTVVRAGRPGDAFFIILNGNAQVHLPDGRTQMLGANAFFGELALFDDAPRAATVTSVGGLTTARIARPDFAQLLREEPSIGLDLARGLVGVVRDFQRAGAVEQAGVRRSDAPLAREAPAEPSETSAKEALDLVAQVPLFGALNKRHLRRVVRLAELKEYRGGRTVVREGARGDSFFIVLAGQARVETPDGHDHDLGPGDYFGELALLDGALRAATVTASEDLTTLRLSRAAFGKLLRDEPTIGVGLAKGLVAIVRELQPAAADS